MTSSRPPAMSQKVFDLGLPMETVSLYLLCCGLADAGISLTTKNIADRWNGSETELQDGLSALTQKGILRQVLSDRDRRNVYRLAAPDQWLGPED